MISAYLTDTVTIETPSGVDRWGENTGTAAETVKGRIKFKNKVVRNDRGEQVVAAASVLLKDRPSPLARITFDGRSHAILSVERSQDFGTVAWEVSVN